MCAFRKREHSSTPRVKHLHTGGIWDSMAGCLEAVGDV